MKARKIIKGILRLIGVLEGRSAGRKFSGNFSSAEEGEVGDDDEKEGRDEDGNLYPTPFLPKIIF